MKRYTVEHLTFTR